MCHVIIIHDSSNTTTSTTTTTTTATTTATTTTSLGAADVEAGVGEVQLELLELLMWQPGPLQIIIRV